MIKCIASDMDGTLLNSMETISEENKQAIEFAQEKGVPVVIATGRSYKEARHALEKANLECPIISLNGAVVWDEKGNVVVSNPIHVESFKKARNILDQYNIYYEIFTNKGTYTNSNEQTVAILIEALQSVMPDLDPVFIAERVKERYESDWVKRISQYDELYDIEDIDFYKVLVFSNDIPLLGKVGEDLKQYSNLAISSSGYGNLEITSEYAQKGIALSHFVAKQDIALEETMAIGDNLNDISMFERVGKPVAMGNAPSEIKKLCGETTTTNDENGVAQAIWQALSQ